MKHFAKLVSFLLSAILYIQFMTFSGCSKEYSCEGCFVNDTLNLPDTLPADTTLFVDNTPIDSSLNFPPCSSCDSTQPLPLNTWRFSTHKSYVCGTVKFASFDTEKYSFDFSGYTQCSEDTSFRLVSFFYPLRFTSDRFHVATTNQSLVFQDATNYNNGWAGYIFRTDGTTPSNTLKVVVDSFYHASKLMVGRFYGYAYIRDTAKTYVDGRFRFVVQ